MTYFGGFRYKFPELDKIPGELLVEIGDTCSDIDGALHASLLIPDFKAVYYFLVVRVYRDLIPQDVLQQGLASTICSFLRIRPTEVSYSAEQVEYICKIMKFLAQFSIQDREFKNIFETLMMLEYKHPTLNFGFFLLHLIVIRKGPSFYTEYYESSSAGVVLKPQRKLLWTNKTYPCTTENSTFIIACIAYLQEARYFYQSFIEKFEKKAVVKGIEDAVNKGFLPQFFLRYIQNIYNNVSPLDFYFTSQEIDGIGWTISDKVVVQEKHCEFFGGSLVLAHLGLPLYVTLWIMDFLVDDDVISHWDKVKKLKRIYAAVNQRRAANKLQLILYSSPESFQRDFVRNRFVADTLSGFVRSQTNSENFEILRSNGNDSEYEDRYIAFDAFPFSHGDCNDDDDDKN